MGLVLDINRLHDLEYVLTLKHLSFWSHQMKGLDESLNLFLSSKMFNGNQRQLVWVDFSHVSQACLARRAQMVPSFHDIIIGIDKVLPFLCHWPQ